METLAEIRRLILEVDREILEERKWIKPSNPDGVPVWSRAGIVCTGEIYKQTVKVTFAHGAALKDPSGLFNSSLEGGTRRAIDLRENESLEANAFQDLIREAIAENLNRVTRKAAKKTSKTATGSGTTRPRRSVSSSAGQGVVLLSGGNPQIAKADGDAPVQAYIAAMPEWKSSLGRRLDSLIGQAVPDVRKAVKWNSPFYGSEGRGWFLSFHVLTRYVKVTFFQGALLVPPPPGGTAKSGEARWIDLYETKIPDEAQMLSWIQQAAALPGWVP